MKFTDLPINPVLIDYLSRQNITKPFPIQQITLRDSVLGRDILARAQTGSGKTLAFGLAILSRLVGKTACTKKPLAIILVPTRELAIQINDVIAPLSRSVNLNSQVVAGGLSYSKQIQALKRGVPIVVATPGRLIDLIQKQVLQLALCMVVKHRRNDQECLKHLNQVRQTRWWQLMLQHAAYMLMMYH
jgi:superfamily II DNA/RNA helicase